LDRRGLVSVRASHPASGLIWISALSRLHSDFPARLPREVKGVQDAKVNQELAELIALRERLERVREEARSLIEQYHQILSHFGSNRRSSVGIPTIPPSGSVRSPKGPVAHVETAARTAAEGVPPPRNLSAAGYSACAGCRWGSTEPKPRPDATRLTFLREREPGRRKKTAPLDQKRQPRNASQSAGARFRGSASSRTWRPRSALLSPIAACSAPGIS